MKYSYVEENAYFFSLQLQCSNHAECWYSVHPHCMNSLCTGACLIFHSCTQYSQMISSNTIVWGHFFTIFNCHGVLYYGFYILAIKYSFVNKLRVKYVRSRVKYENIFTWIFYDWKYFDFEKSGFTVCSRGRSHVAVKN